MFVLALLTCIMLRAFSAQAKVVMCFEECKESFYKTTEPRGMDPNGKKICQKHEHGGFIYATLYSVSDRIPLYSAYTFDPACSSTAGRTDDWYIEPQISQPDSRTEYMVREKELDEDNVKRYQAISSDYSDTGYIRGQLNPSSFQCKDGLKATFTLTNAAPMDACFNHAYWKSWESALRSFLKTKLDSDGGSAAVYIVTGTVTVANVKIPQKEISEDPERVTVPSHIWTAVCYKHHSDDTKSFSFGYVGDNQPEGSVSLMSVSDLNKRLSELSKTQSISIFVDDCSGDRDKLNMVQGVFDKFMNVPGLQVTSDVQNTLGALRRAVNSGYISSVNSIKMSKLTGELTIDSMDAYVNVTEELKDLAGIACLITKVKPANVSGLSDAVECLLVPEKQMTAADGSHCSSVSESSSGCECDTGGETKPCCSSPCLYQHTLNSYRCYSGQKLIPCSPRYSLITANGARCLDDHPCATYDKDYYWCNTTSGSWDYCSPPLWRSKTLNGKYCRSNHACAKYGKDQLWCYTDHEGNYDDCCISYDCYSTVTGLTCRSDDPCGARGYTYPWCYTDSNGSWIKCCKECVNQ
ncbi:uncharacterized protein LOC127508791 [Ctenopharyngodon idella]|uniref:uncharacterized protein LOC127508791 n=1 Tax=Ctenopharyngodon idella TaxID=7959 RepID=UPI00222F152C|nr:uncharacterized protein LOC127508791 [Ctenopharyngodon idella]